jgi:hypothetical protein
MNMENHGGMILTENQRTRRKAYINAAFLATDHTWTAPEENPELRGERPATN